MMHEPRSGPEEGGRTPEVSVVVATYSPGDGLDRLVRSLDAQTLPADRFEVIFVDDGSPDHTVERLQRIASTRPNVRVQRIENSGWASRPRNVGTDLAVGEYVLYLDHDDELYPDALRAAASYARDHGADVLNGKEARTQDAGWALDTYRADSAQDVGRLDAHPLVPMNPHKLYRTAFLREHGIRFPEGRRVLWEDIVFNVQVAAHASTIATLSSVPFYHWVQTGGSGSSTFRRSDPDWWRHLERVLDAIVEQLGHDTLQGTQLRRHQYRSRILGSFGPEFLKRPQSERELIEQRARALQARFADADDDRALDRGARLVAAALRSGDADVLALAASTAGTDRFAVPVLDRAHWNDGRLVLHVTGDTVPRLPGGGTFRLEGERVLAASADLLSALDRLDHEGEVESEVEIDGEVDGEASELDADVASELDATTATFTVRGRTSRIGWAVPSTITDRALVPTPDGAEARFTFGVDGELDARATAMPALDDQVWDVFLRIDRVGRLQHPRVRSTAGALPALVDGRTAVAYTNRDGHLSVDLGGHVASIFDGATPASVRMTTTTAGGVTVTLSLPGVPVSGDAGGRGWILLSYRRAGLPSRLRGVARLLLRKEHPPVRFPVRFSAAEASDRAAGPGRGTPGVTAALELPGPGRYHWRPSERGTDLPAWSLHARADAAELVIARA